MGSEATLLIGLQFPVTFISDCATINIYKLLFHLSSSNCLDIPVICYNSNLYMLNVYAVHTYIHVLVAMYFCMYACMYVCTYIYTYVCMFVFMYVRMCM